VSIEVDGTRWRRHLRKTWWDCVKDDVIVLAGPIMTFKIKMIVV